MFLKMILINLLENVFDKFVCKMFFDKFVWKIFLMKRFENIYDRCVFENISDEFVWKINLIELRLWKIRLGTNLFGTF